MAILQKKKIIVISGPTASGKSFLGVELAKVINGVILNADSMQIYKDLPILSAQPTEEERAIVEHRLYNIFDPKENNNVHKWLNLIEDNCNDVLKQGKTPIILGGTGMYISRFIHGIKSLPDISEGLRTETINLYENLGFEKFYEQMKLIDLEYVSKLNKNDKQRLMRVYEIHKLTGKNLTYFEDTENTMLFAREQIFHINLIPDRDILYDRCELRFKLMFENNQLFKEVIDFVDKYPYIFDEKQKYSILNTIGFREVYSHLQHKISFDEMFQTVVKITRHYAKRQFTWFRHQFKNTEFLLEAIPKKDNINEILKQILEK